MTSPQQGHAALLAAVVERAPKAELHVHVEGTLQPELAFTIARRNGIELPWSSPEALARASPFSDLQSFLDVYYAAAAVLRTEEDFHDLAWDYLCGARRDNVVRAEIFFDPQMHTARGIPFETVVGGLSRAIDRGRRELGLSAALILCFLRHLPEADGIETLERALPFRDRFIGVGLDSGERGNPPEKFRDLFARCRRAGLHCVAHAGEEGPPAFITGALDALGAERIDHGVRCLEDDAVVARLVRERIPLTVCPLSNVRLRVFDSLATHNLSRLLAAGLKASIHSDDPAYFGGSINEAYIASVGAMPLTAAAAHRLLRNSLESAFWEPSEAAPHLDRLEVVFAEAGLETG